MDKLKFPDGVYLVDFEFLPVRGHEGNPPDPVCMVVREWPSGRTSRHWQSDLKAMAIAPFPTGGKTLCVAFYASAEMDCFSVLGWPQPHHVLDLFAEFRCLTNGLRLAHGSGLLGALMHFGLPTIGGEQKDAMRDLVLTGGPWSQAQAMPINRSGGLKSKGHPVGATGVAQIADVTLQIRGQATGWQLAKADIGLAQNLGGSGATSVVTILGKGN